jgi:hypothetical protein
MPSTCARTSYPSRPQVQPLKKGRGGAAPSSIDRSNPPVDKRGGDRLAEVGHGAGMTAIC